MSAFRVSGQVSDPLFIDHFSRLCLPHPLALATLFDNGRHFTSPLPPQELKRGKNAILITLQYRTLRLARAAAASRN
jgi:hypothetical protein